MFAEFVAETTFEFDLFYDHKVVDFRPYSAITVTSELAACSMRCISMLPVHAQKFRGRFLYRQSYM